MIQYPKWKYSQKFEPVLVHSKDQEDALGSDWSDSPAKFGVVSSPEKHQAGESLEGYVKSLQPYKIEEKPKAKAKS